jgi:hypothetical protein
VLPLVLVGPEDGELRPKYVGLLSSSLQTGYIR